MYLVPADVVPAVVIVLATLAVPVKLAVTVVHVNVPPVLVKARVFGLYVSAVACVFSADAAVPLVALVNSIRNTVADNVLLIVIVEPDPVDPCGIDMSKIAAELVPTFVTVALDPGAPVVTVPTEIVAADPADPAGP